MRKYSWLLILLISAGVQAQDPAINPKLLHGFWKAQWIAHPTASGTQFGVFISGNPLICLQSLPALW